MTFFTKSAVLAAMMTLSWSAAAESKSDKLAVKRLVLAHGVDNHEPQEATSSFKTQDDRVYAFVELQNPQKIEGKIHVVFTSPDGKTQPEIELGVGPTKRFRTWAFTKKAHQAGEWGVAVRDGEGRVLARDKFTVEK